jgi:hypothetical protein
MKYLLATAALLAMIGTAPADLAWTEAKETCLTIDYDNSPIAAVSGRITNHHEVPKGDLRAAKGPFLVLDQPLIADLGFGCTNIWKIGIFTTKEDTKRMKQQLIAGKRVKMTGKLGRFGSALVDPSVFIENYEIK